MLAFTPLQGFTADSIISSALDNVTLVESNGKATVNLNNDNSWGGVQSFLQSIYLLKNYTANLPNELDILLDNNPGSDVANGQHYYIARRNNDTSLGLPNPDFAIILYDGTNFIPVYASDYTNKETGTALNSGWKHVSQSLTLVSSLGTPPINTTGNTTMATDLNANYLNYSNRSFAFNNSLSGVYDTTSTTPVSTGGGITLSNIITNVGAFMIGSVQISNNTLGDYVTAEVYRSTAGIPAAGSAPPSTDTIVASYSIAQEGLGSNSHIFSFMDYVAFSNSNSSLSPSPTTYYWYLTIYANAGTAFAEAMQMAAVAM